MNLLNVFDTSLHRSVLPSAIRIASMTRSIAWSVCSLAQINVSDDEFVIKSTNEWI